MEKRLIYIDENDFIKKTRSLRTYCMLAYKDFVFKTKDKIFENVEKDGLYYQNLRTSTEFRNIYGQIRLKYLVKNSTIILIDLEPSQFFIDGYMSKLGTYKGMYCRDDRDKFKIELVSYLKKGKNYGKNIKTILVED